MHYDHDMGGGTKRRAARRAARRRRRRQAAAVLFSLLLIAAIFAGTAAAYVWMRTAAAENTFTPGKVSCEVTEDFDGSIKRDVAVKNTGNTEAYIRATVNITWMRDENASAQTVSARLPQEGQDYSISYFSDGGWIKGADGFWYCQSPIAPNGSTPPLIKDCRLAEGANPPRGYHLSVEIAASAIQAAPAAVVTERWKAVLDDSLKIIAAGESEVAG